MAEDTSSVAAPTTPSRGLDTPPRAGGEGDTSPPANRRTGFIKEELDRPETRIYEVGYLVFPTVAAEDLPREATAIKDLLEKEGTRAFAEEMPRMRTLAYPMRKHTRTTPPEAGLHGQVGLTAGLPARNAHAGASAEAGGAYQTFGNAYFGWVKFEGDTAAAKRLDAALRQMEKVLRFILVKTVRESTLSAPRPRPEFRREPKTAPKAPPSVPTPVSDVELEKAMEKLIAE